MPRLTVSPFQDLSDERFGVKLRVTENRCVFFDFSTYVYVYKGNRMNVSAFWDL